MLKHMKKIKREKEELKKIRDWRIDVFFKRVCSLIPRNRQSSANNANLPFSCFSSETNPCVKI